MKRGFRYILFGALAGMGVQYLLAILISGMLHLGYLLPYPPPLAENLHGEMNAVLLEAFLSAGLGAEIGLLLCRRHG